MAQNRAVPIVALEVVVMRTVPACLVLAAWLPLASVAGTENFVPPPGPSESEVQGWVQSSYPGLLESSALPEGLVLGFVVTPDFKIIRHSATMQRMGIPINRDLERMFPPLSFERPPMAGADCFPASGGKPKYCVYWAVAPVDAQTSGTQ